MSARSTKSSSRSSGSCRLDRVELLGRDDHVALARELVALDHVVVGAPPPRSADHPPLRDPGPGLPLAVGSARFPAHRRVQLDQHIEQEPDELAPLHIRAWHRDPSGTTRPFQQHAHQGFYTNNPESSVRLRSSTSAPGSLGVDLPPARASRPVHPRRRAAVGAPLGAQLPAEAVFLAHDRRDGLGGGRPAPLHGASRGACRPGHRRTARARRLRHAAEVAYASRPCRPTPTSRIVRGRLRRS